MSFDPAKLKTQAEALQFMKNAERLGRRDLYQAALGRYCELSGTSEAQRTATVRNGRLR